MPHNFFGQVTQPDVTGLTAALAAKVGKGDLVFSVKDYGAVGDGTTDDRVAIQSAVTAAAAVKGTVFFPPGTYRVTMLSGSTPLRALSMPASPVTFSGAGSKSSIIKLASSVGEYVTMFGHAGADDVGGVSFRDLGFDQNNTNNQLTSTTALLSGSARYVIYWTNATAPVSIQRCEFTDLDNVNTVAANGAVHNLTVRDCRFAIGSSPINHDHSTIYHHPLASHSVWVEDNVFTSPGSGSNSAVTAIETHGSSQFIRNNDVRNFHIGANLTGVGNSIGEGIVCDGNSFLDVRYGVHLWSMPYTGGVTANPTLRSLVFRDNTIRIDVAGWSSTFTSGQSVAGIRLGGATGSIEDVTIENNWITFVNGSYTGSSTTDSSANGIDWYRATLDSAIVDRRVSIRHNTIVSALAAGIRVSCYGESFDVSDNTVLNCGRGSVAAGGTVLNAYAVGVSITGVLTHSRVNRNVLLDTQGTHTMDIALWLYPLATGSANNQCFDNHASGYVTKLLQPHDTNGGWKFRATTLASFASPGGLLAVDSTITERSTGLTYRQVAAPEGATWGVPIPANASPLVSGSYVDPPGIRSTGQMAASTEYAVPVEIGTTGTLDRIGIEITTAGTAGTVIRLGIRSALTNGRPGTLLLDAGTVAGDAIANVEATISLSITVPGTHWLTATAQSTGATLPSVRITQADRPQVQIQTLGQALGSSLLSGYVTSATVTGALGSSYTIANRTGIPPLLVVRAA